MLSLKTVYRKWVAVAVFTATVLVAGAAGAQSLIQPPVIASVDGNGVDLTTGKFTLPGLNVDIGASGSGISRNAGLNGSDNNTGILKLTVVGTPSTINYFYLDASFGGVTTRQYLGYALNSTVGFSFANNGPYYSNGNRLDCDGTTLLPIGGGYCHLTLADGTVAAFDRSYNSSTQFGALTSVTRPDGELLTYSYYLVGTEIKAIKSVSSTLGWMLKYEVDGNYKVTKVTAINSSVAYCDPQAASCSVSTSFPYATLSTSGSTTTIARNGTNLLNYTISGNMVTLTSPGGVTKTITYSGTDTTGQVASISTGGSTWNYSYSAGTTTVTAPNGTTTKLTMGTFGVASTTDEANRVTTYVYDSNTSSPTLGKVLKVLAPDGSATTGGYTAYTYDSRGNVTTTSVVPKNGASSGVANTGAALVTQSHFPTCDYSSTGNYKYCNKPDYLIDADGVRTDYSYDSSHGGILSETKPAVSSVAHQIRYSYSQLTPQLKNSGGALVAQAPVWRLTGTSSCMSSNWTGSACAAGATDEAKGTISYTSTNLLPNSSTVKLGDGTLAQTTTTDYTDNGLVAAVDGPKSGTVDKVYRFYDALGRAIGAIGVDPDNTGPRNRPANRTAYDLDGHAIEVDTGTASGTDLTALNAMTVQERDTNAYSSAGLPAAAKHFVGTSVTPKDVTQRSYDNMLRITCEAVRLNPVDYGALPASACTLGTVNADGSHDRITQYNYHPVTGVVVSTVSGYGTSVARSDVIKTFDTGSATSTGTLSYVEDAKGNRTSYFYDLFNRLTKTCYPMSATVHTSSTTDCEQQAYRTTSVTGSTQASSLISTVTLRDNTTIFFAYDGLGRVAAKTGAVSESFTYDNFSQVRTHTNNTTGGAAASETYGYNALGWLTSDQQPMGTLTYGYDAYGKRNQMTYPGGGLYVTYAYNDGDELTGIFENGSVQISSFTYDDYGRRTSLGRGNGVSTTYGYDASLRLGSITQGTTGASFFNQVSYSYAPSDQIASKTATNANYNYTPIGKSVSYGIDGLNRIATASGTSLVYDLRGNMTSDGGGTYVYNANNLLTSATQSGVTSTLTYDAENRLLSISKNGGTTKYLYDGVDMIAEYNGSGTLLRRYVHGPGDDEPLVWYEGSGTATKYYLGADDLGSVTVITNGSGAQYALNTYDEYGLPGAANTGRFQYTGQTWLPEIGMYYYKARLYSPILGRFMQTDPIGYGDGMNWYAYVGNDPVNGSDPSGLDGTTCPGYGTTTGTQCNPDGSTVVVVTADCWSNPRCAEHRMNRIDQMINDMNAQRYSDWSRLNSLCGDNITCQQHVFGGIARYTDDTITRPGFLTYTSVITAPTLILDGAAIGEAALAFRAGKGLKAVGEAVGEFCVHCLVAGTSVATPHGLMAIEDIKVGDTVLAFNEQTGQVTPETVTALIRPNPQATFSVKLTDAKHGIDVFRASADHPWLLASGEWKDTTGLKHGDRIKTATGIALSVVSITPSGKVEQTYNLTIDGLHTYLIGRNHVVVHNAICQKAVAEAERLYPKLVGKFQDHHITPRYLGGAKNGELARIPAAYHQMITNAFRAIAPYGTTATRAMTSPEVQAVMARVYAVLPLP